MFLTDCSKSAASTVDAGNGLVEKREPIIISNRN
jgi:hypothetical protein